MEVYMQPKFFKDSNTLLCPPIDWVAINHGNCKNLTIRRENGVCISCWHVSFKERIQILFGTPVYLHIVSGETQPAVKILTGRWEV